MVAALASAGAARLILWNPNCSHRPVPGWPTIKRPKTSPFWIPRTLLCCRLFRDRHRLNEPHLRAIVDEITEKLRLDHDLRPFSTEGARVTPWVVLDFIDVIVHVMNEEFRELYDLENLWGDGKKIDFEPEPSPVAGQA